MVWSLRTAGRQSPQRAWHGRLVTSLTVALMEMAPSGIEVVSSWSAHRDRTVKLRKYAETGTPHYWCIEDEDGAPMVHV